MAMDERVTTALKEYVPSRIPLPENPEIIEIDGYKVIKYIDSKTLDALIKRFSDHIKLEWFDAVLVNMKGGEFFAKKLFLNQGYKYNGRVTHVEYSRSGEVRIPIPFDLRQKNIVIVEDCLDSGNTAKKMIDHAPKATILFLTEKYGIDDQVKIDNRFSVVKIPPVYIGGGGINADTDGDGLPLEFARNYQGIIVKIQK